ncbi:DMT family transporter [Streptomyces sp. NPDC002734]|uniref:DMT family transporter n=1 Tax=Streptomyces sp. NPDC002734 TaxID=3154426 RepID=UPI0033240286
MSPLMWSVVLSLVSAVAYAGGAIVQERVAVRRNGSLPLGDLVWWAAVALNGVGAGLHVAALALGPLSVVQPMGALTIVFALPMAALFVGRAAGDRTAWRGAFLATAGLAGLLALVSGSGTRTPTGGERIVLVVVTAVVLAALMAVAKGAGTHPAVRAAALATGSGIAFGLGSVFTKAVAADQSDGLVLSGLPSVVAVVALSAAGLLLSQSAYHAGGLHAPLATLTVVNPVAATVVGLVLFGESFRMGALGAVLATGCGVVAAAGLVLLSVGRAHAEVPAQASGEREPAEPAAPDRTPSDEGSSERDGRSGPDGDRHGPERVQMATPPARR